MTSAAQSRRSRAAQPAGDRGDRACVFLVVLTFLAWNLKIGHDPALGSSAPPAQHVSGGARQEPPRVRSGHQIVGGG